MISLYLMGFKGYHVLDSIILNFGKDFIRFVVSSRDANVVADYYDEIAALCSKNEIPFFDKIDASPIPENICVAVGWKWIVKNPQRLIVLHDSLLPAYRGFNPLVTALLEGDNKIGATAIWASKDFDRGDIIITAERKLEYPVKVRQAIEWMADCYNEICQYICTEVKAGRHLHAVPQDEQLATYSLWRDELDYHIDWSRDSLYIKRFIDTLGFPYKGAFSIINGEIIRITNAEVYDDYKIINRNAGKVIKIENQVVHVVCGTGILGVIAMERDADRHPFLLNRVRTRFE